MTRAGWFLLAVALLAGCESVMPDCAQDCIALQGNVFWSLDMSASQDDGGRVK